MGHVYIVVEVFWRHVYTVLEDEFWGRFNTVLEVCWGHVYTVLELFGDISIKFWRCLGDMF